MGLRNWLSKFTSDWTTIDSGVLFDVTDHGHRSVISYYEAKIQKHKETGEVRILNCRDRGSQVTDVSAENVPNVLEPENGFGMSTVVYRAEYIKRGYSQSE
jgi:hypothetical protein